MRAFLPIISAMLLFCACSNTPRETNGVRVNDTIQYIKLSEYGIDRENLCITLVKEGGVIAQGFLQATVDEFLTAREGFVAYPFVAQIPLCSISPDSLTFALSSDTLDFVKEPIPCGTLSVDDSFERYDDIKYGVDRQQSRYTISLKGDSLILYHLDGDEWVYRRVLLRQ